MNKNPLTPEMDEHRDPTYETLVEICRVGTLSELKLFVKSLNLSPEDLKNLINRVDGFDRTPLYHSLRVICHEHSLHPSYGTRRKGSHPGEEYKIAIFLLERGADFTLVPKSGATPLYAAVRSGNTEAVRYILRKGGNPDCQNSEKNWSTVQEASIECKHEILDLLARHGADIKLPRTENGDLPIFLAMKCSVPVPTLEVFFKYGVSPNVVNAKGQNLLWCLEINTYKGPFDFLIGKKIDINHRDLMGNTALISIGQLTLGYEYLIRDFVKNKADINARNFAGESLFTLGYRSFNGSYPYITHDFMGFVALIRELGFKPAESESFTWNLALKSIEAFS